MAIPVRLAKSVVMAVLVKNGQQVLVHITLVVVVDLTKGTRPTEEMAETVAVVTALPQSIMAHLLYPPQRVRRTRAVAAAVAAVLAVKSLRLVALELLLLDIWLIHHLRVLQYLRVLQSLHQ